jgi:hypothetical protein
MLAQYGSHGLTVTVMSATKRWIDYGDYLPALAGPFTPAEEAEIIRKYYQEYERLPVTVGIQVRRFTQRPAPDGRFDQVEPVVSIPGYCEGGVLNEGDFGCAVLAGRDGTVLWVGSLVHPKLEGDLYGRRKGEFAEVLAKAIAQGAPDAPDTPASSAMASPPSPSRSSSNPGHQ